MNELDQRTQEIRTICRDCTFAEFDENYTHQIGCELNRLSKFQSLNKTLETIDEETGLKYFEIRGVCNLCRSAEWKMLYENYIEKALEEIKLRLAFVVLGDRDDIKLTETLNKCINQTLKPHKIVLIFFRRSKSSSGFISLLNKSGIKYEVVNVLDKDGKGYLIDTAVKKIKSQFYTVVEEGFAMPVDFIEKFDRMINHDLKQISMILPAEQLSGLTVQVKLHNLIGGNNNLPVQEKIAELAKNQNSQHMISDTTWSI